MWLGRSVFRPLAKGVKNKLGFNPHAAYFDEFLAYKTDAIVKVIQTGMGARVQPMVVIITTSGDLLGGPCHLEYEFACQVLDGSVESDSYFAAVFEIDLPGKEEGGKDEYSVEERVKYLLEHPEKWIQSNPNIGETPSREFLQAQLEEAKRRPDIAKDNLVLNFGFWIGGTASSWFQFHYWKQCAAKRGEMELRKALEGQICYGGLDLASMHDLTAFGLLFPETWHFLVWHWCPEVGIQKRIQQAGVRYDLWLEREWIEATPGERISTPIIGERIKEICDHYQVQRIGYDEWNALTMVNNLEAHGLTMVKVGRHYSALSPPSRELQIKIENGTFRHGNNPCLNWQAGHIAVKRDGADIRPVRPDEDNGCRAKKIDGLYTAVQAMSLAMRGGGPAKKPSPYETRGVRYA